MPLSKPRSNAHVWSARWGTDKSFRACQDNIAFNKLRKNHAIDASTEHLHPLELLGVFKKGAAKSTEDYVGIYNFLELRFIVLGLNDLNIVGNQFECVAPVPA